MKHIKIFEDLFDNNLYDTRRYWLLPTDERFKKSLKKIKCTKDRTREFLINEQIKDMYVFIGYNPERGNTESDKWGWDKYFEYYNDGFYEKNDYKFMGKININDYELDANKFNI